VPLPSLIKENTRFMDIRRLQELSRDPGKSRRVRQVMDDFIRADQQRSYLESVAQGLTGEGSRFTFDSGGAEVLTIERVGAGGSNEIRGDGLHIFSGGGGTARSVRVTQSRGGRATLAAEAQQIVVRALPDSAGARLDLVVELQDAIVNDVPRVAFRRDDVSVPMPGPVKEIENRPVEHYLHSDSVPTWNKSRLKRQWVVISNGTISELHARMAFALSCLILVVVGCALGVMFKSGNFLTAFAVSVVPAMLCIMLIVTGQHVCEKVGWDMTKYHNTMPLGLTLIWSGNVAVLAIAVALLGRLQRQ
jgi:hypothetical protein